MPSDLERATARFRRSLLAQDKQSRAAVQRSYRAAIASLRSELRSALDAIAAIRAEGGEVPTWRLLQEQRVRQLLARAEIEFARHAATVQQTTIRAQQDAIRRAQDESVRLIEAGFGPPPAGAVLPIHTLPLGAIQELTAALQPNVPVRRLLQEFAGDAVEAIQDELVGGVAAGNSPAQITRQIVNRLGREQRVRAERIVRTTAMNAYRESTRMMMVENRHIVPKYVWYSAMDRRCCVICIANHGREFSVDTKMATHPNCFPAGTLVAGPPVIGSTTRWYDGDLVEIGLRSGAFFSVTPNHPILTPDGWVAAGLLNKGSNVVRCLDTQRMIAIVNPNHDDGPALIEDVAVAFGGAAGVASARVPTAAEDFHGDGIDGDVCVVRADCFLGRAFDAPVRQPSLQEQFSGRRVRLPLLSGLSAAQFFVQGMHATTGGVLSGRHEFFPFLWRHSRKADDHAFRTTARRNTCFQNAMTDKGSRYVKRFGQCVFRFARLITSNDLVIRHHDAALLEHGHNLCPACLMPFVGKQSKRSPRRFLCAPNMDAGCIQHAFQRLGRNVMFASKNGQRFPRFVASYGIREPVRLRNRLPPSPDPEFNATTFEALSDGPGIGPEHAHQVRDRLAGLVTTDQVVKVRIRPFTGHVYNLQTTEGWYSANGIITHNCRCVMLPVTKSWRDLGFDVPDTRPQIQTGPEVFATWSKADQLATLGPAAYAEFAAGNLELSDLVVITRSTVWGTGRRRRSLSDALRKSKGAA